MTKPDPAPEPRRLTPTERGHEIAMAAIQRKPSEPESSVTITRNARGVHQFEVTVRHGDARIATSVAEEIVRELTTAYPYPAGPTNGGETT